MTIPEMLADAAFGILMAMVCVLDGLLAEFKRAASRISRATTTILLGFWP